MSTTRRAQRRYNRLAQWFDLAEWPMERGGLRAWRRRLWQGVAEGRVLEVGVGTGKNLPFYPAGAHTLALDFSPAMLTRALARSHRNGYQVSLTQMDAQALALHPAVFDTAVASFVFCSVPDPVRGLQEVRRVLRPGGQLRLLEHVRPGGLLGRLVDWLNPLARRFIGDNINRPTLANVTRAGFAIRRVERLMGSLVLLIEAEAP